MNYEIFLTQLVSFLLALAIITYPIMMFLIFSYRGEQGSSEQEFICDMQNYSLASFK